MSIWITQVETKKQVQKKQSITQWYKNLILKILDLLKSYCVQSTYISKLQNQSLDLNGCRTVITLTSIYRSLFKINMTFQIIFMVQIQINVKYHISSLNFSLDQKVPTMQYFKYALWQIEKCSTHKFMKSLQNGIRIQQLIYFQFDRSLSHAIAQNTAKYVLQTHMLCNAMITDLQNQLLCPLKVSKEQQKIKRSVDAYRGIEMVEKQNQNFRKYYKEQNNGVSFLANPQEITERPNQILRQLNIQASINRKPLKPSKNDSRYYGAYSNLYKVEAFGSIIDTYINHRQNKQNEEQDPDYKPGMTQGSFKLIEKQPGNDYDAKKSMENQINYLKKKGGHKIPYICNYFLPSKKPTKSKDKKPKQQPPEQQKLYSQFHEDRTFERFHHGYQFTLLDVINFAQQLMIGLLEFYLNLGYLNRDVKEENILINKKGVIQIIDHGSIYPYKMQVQNPMIQREKKLFDPQLRSTIYCKRQMFYQDPDLVAKYKNNTTYRNINSTHKTFDVYSVGRMLQEILQTYELMKYPKWIQVGQRLKKLTHYMTQKDPQLRIQMKTALQELRTIRKFIYQHETKE